MMLAWLSASEMIASSFVRIAETGTGVRREAALEHDDGFCLLEGGQPLFQLHVDRHRAGDRADRA